MEITLDLTALQVDPNANPFTLAWQLFLAGGWVIVVIMLVIGLWQVRFYRAQLRFEAKQQFILLAIDVPRENEQSLKAVEQIFAHLHGIKKEPTLWEKHILGETQVPFSMEIVSIDGFIQFLIRSPKKHRDIVEAAIYAHYPDATIAEVEDYTQRMHHLKFPNKEYDLWGTEFRLTQSEVYPIRTYPNFEHGISQKMIDPIASVLETMSRLKEGEQMWFQWVITPAGSHWVEEGIHKVKKLIKAKVEHKKDFFDKIIEGPSNVLWDLGQSVISTPVGEGGGKHADAPPSLMMHMTTGEKGVVEGIETKIAKLGFYTKFRFIYIGKKEIFTKSRVLSVLGVVKQFSTYNLNGFKNHKRVKTSVDYFFTKQRLAYRQRRVLHAFVERSQERGGGEGQILNIEEMASLYHFPSLDVKAPLVKKAEVKRGEPPATLPTGGGFSPAGIPVMSAEPPASDAKTPPASPPENLPIG